MARRHLDFFDKGTGAFTLGRSQVLSRATKFNTTFIENPSNVPGTELDARPKEIKLDSEEIRVLYLTQRKILGLALGLSILSSDIPGCWLLCALALGRVKRAGPS